MEVNVQEDFDAVNSQLQKLVEELNRVSGTREQLMQQIQNLNGVAMYLRGKLPPEDLPVDEGLETDVVEEGSVDSLERSNEYPVNS